MRLLRNFLNRLHTSVRVKLVLNYSFFAYECSLLFDCHGLYFIHNFCSCLEDCVGLLSLLGDSGALADKAKTALPLSEIDQKADSLVRTLLAGRAYVDHVTNTYDPRFLIFEFQSNILLRDRQIGLVKRFVDSIRGKKHDIVEQMIMGAGKTTVISPLVCLLLADGHGLVAQVCIIVSLLAGF